MKKTIYGFIMTAVCVFALVFAGASFTGCEFIAGLLFGEGYEGEPEDGGDGSGGNSPLMTGIWNTVDVGEKWNSVIYGNGTFVAVGSEIAYSKNGGETWTVVATPDHELADVGFGGGLFVAVATKDWVNGSGGDNGGYYITSADGTSWGSLTQLFNPYAYALHAVTYENNQFVFTGRHTGPNGAVFTATVSGSSLTGWSSQKVIGQWVDIVYSGSRLVVVGIGENNGWTATTPWPERGIIIPNGNNKKLYGVTYGAGRFVAVGSNNIILNSTDGSDWATVSPLDDGGEWRGVAYNGAGMFVAVARGGAIASSADGVSWTLQEASLESGAEWRSVTYGGGRFVAVSYTGRIAYCIPAGN